MNLLDLAPSFLRHRVEHRPGLVRILDNIGWLFVDRIVRLGMGLLVGVWVARYLGPDQFGLLNYALAFVALFGAIATLGLDGIVVRDLVKQPKTANVTLGTAFLLQLFGGLLAFGLAVTLITFIQPSDSLTRLVVAILGSALVFKATETVKYWFESQVQSKYTVWVENAAFLTFAGIKILLILNKAPLIAFVWAILAEAVLVAIALLTIYAWRGGQIRGWSFDPRRAESLLRDSWPLILSGLTIMVYMRIDQIMLGQMLDANTVGIYSAAVRISEVWYTIPIIITSSVFPSIINASKKDEHLYETRMQTLLDFMALTSIVIAIGVSFSSDQIIHILYGAAFSGSSDVLAIHVWANLFVFLGVAGSKWYLIENLQHLSLYRTATGAVLNVALNLYLIPSHGAYGAAIATVISYAMAAYFLDISSRSTRHLFIAKTRAIFLWPHILLPSDTRLYPWTRK